MDRPRLLLSDHAFIPRGALKGLLGILWAAFLARIPSSLTENCNFFQFLFPCVPWATGEADHRPSSERRSTGSPHPGRWWCRNGHGTGKVWLQGRRERSAPRPPSWAWSQVTREAAQEDGGAASPEPLASSPQSPFPSSSRRHCLSLWLKGFQMGVPVRRNVTDRCRKNSLTPSGSQDLRDAKFF